MRSLFSSSLMIKVPKMPSDYADPHFSYQLALKLRDLQVSDAAFNHLLTGSGEPAFGTLDGYIDYCAAAPVARFLPFGGHFKVAQRMELFLLYLEESGAYSSNEVQLVAALKSIISETS